MRKTLVFYCLLFAFVAAFGQVAGLTREGKFLDYSWTRTIDLSYIDKYGKTTKCPCLNQYGEELLFPPIISTDSATLIGDNSIAMAAHYNCIGADVAGGYHRYRFQYSTNAQFSTLTDCYEFSGHPREGTVFRDTIRNLSYYTTYYIRAFAKNGIGSRCGEVLSLRTAAGNLVIDSIDISEDRYGKIWVYTDLADRGNAPVSGETCISGIGNHDTNTYCKTFQNLATLSPYVYFNDLIRGEDYRIRSIVSNTRYVDTVYKDYHHPTDLVATILRVTDSTLYPCDSGYVLYYKASLTGTDPHIHDYQYIWHSSKGEVFQEDSAFRVAYYLSGISDTIHLVAFRGVDTIRARLVVNVTYSRVTSKLTVCTNEFLNTADANCTNIASTIWLDSLGNVAATDPSVKLPQGDYTLVYTDIYGCAKQRDVYIGKLKLSCPIAGEPGENESAHLEDGVWRVDSIADHEGNWYAVTPIGEQCWMRQNMRVTTSPTRGDIFTLGDRAYEGGYLYRNNVYDPETLPYYGFGYTWPAAMDHILISNYDENEYPYRGICPQGWHIPSPNEIAELCDVAVAEHYPDMVPYPPFANIVTVARLCGSNTPINYMLEDICAETTSSSYGKSVFNCTHLSLVTSLAFSSSHITFWCTGKNITLGLGLLISTQSGAIIHSESTKTPNYVRCIRN